MKKALFRTIFFLFISTIFSCSDDDNEQPCQETNVVMTNDGEVQNFEAVGRGISLRQNGYELTLKFRRSDENPFFEQHINLTLPYKKTGKNIVEHFNYREYADGILFERDLMLENIEINVIKNTDLCFYATFSGTILKDGELNIIEDGILSYSYEESFDE